MIYQGDLATRLAASLDRQSDMAQLIQRLFARIEEQNVLLQSALHDLADAKKKPGESHAHFVSEWYRRKARAYL